MADWLEAGSDDDGDGDMALRDLKIAEERLYNSGFREGRALAEEKIMQNGFNAGFSEGFKSGFRVGKVMGFASVAIQDKEAPSQAHALLSTLDQQFCHTISNPLSLATVDSVDGNEQHQHNPSSKISIQVALEEKRVAGYEQQATTIVCEQLKWDNFCIDFKK